MKSYAETSGFSFLSVSTVLWSLLSDSVFLGSICTVFALVCEAAFHQQCVSGIFLFFLLPRLLSSFFLPFSSSLLSSFSFLLYFCFFFFSFFFFLFFFCFVLFITCPCATPKLGTRWYFLRAWCLVAMELRGNMSIFTLT